MVAPVRNKYSEQLRNYETKSIWMIQTKSSPFDYMISLNAVNSENL
jgi:hypothetical protein